MNRGIRNIFGLLVLAITALGFSAVPALAAPSLGVTLERDAAEFPAVHHSDERVDFTVKVKNLAPKTESVSPGDELSCSSGNGWNYATSFAFSWLSDGVEVGAGSIYEVQAADEGHVLQCLVKGEGAAGATSAASLPLVVGSPSPAPPDYSGLGEPRPNTGNSTVLNPTETEFTCTPPTAGVWTGSPTWSYQWLRNGVPIAGATSPTYIAHTGTGEEDHLVGIQCEVKGENAAGAVVAISNIGGFTGTPSEFEAEYGVPFPPINNTLPLIVDPNSTSGTITLELELPGGEETFAFETEREGWSCEKIPASGAQHARAVCSREDGLAPAEEFKVLKVITALGADAPDIATARATAFGGGAAPASDELTFPIEPAIPFGLSEFTAAVFDEAENDYTQAGGHPFDGVSDVVVNQKRALVPEESAWSSFLPVEDVRQAIVDIPRGFAGNALALPELCPGVEEVREGKCPPGSAVGAIHIRLSFTATTPLIYAIKPESGTPAQFAFMTTFDNVSTFSVRLRPEDGYGVSLELSPTQEVGVLDSRVTLCDFGVKLSAGFGGCKKAGEPGANPKPLFTNPTRCGVPITTRVHLNSWADPTLVEGPPFANAPITGCEAVPFEPLMKEMTPTSHQADSPTGLDVKLAMPTDGLEDPDGIAQSNLKQARITFPRGMAINASAGHGLGACSAAQVKLKTNLPIECPASSKIGSMEVETPILESHLFGDVYIAKQGAVEGALSGLYIVFDSPKDGILIKVAARVQPDPQTGQLTVTIPEIPEAPFAEANLHFPAGPHSVLLTPPKCGKYEITSELSPWSAKDPNNPSAEEMLTQTNSFEVTEGPNGGPCPSGKLEPKLSSGAEDPTAGKTSPFVFRLHREDGSERFAALSMHGPLGLTAYLAGVPYCPDAVINSIPSTLETGQAEIDHPACPAASQIGIASAGAGAGPDPFYANTGRVYLAGPYKGAPISLVVVAPAVAGPLDLGNVVIRNPIYIDPESTRLTIASDLIPTNLHGILPNIRDIRVIINRPHFTLNPTSCEAKSVDVDVMGETGAIAQVSNRFQASGCERLGFKPAVSARLFGSTKRAGHPRLKGVLLPRPGDANLKRAVVTIPRSEFLDQGHIRTICTRVQFAVHQCPKGSIYGQATGVTPLLDQPLTGPIYLRSSDHELPDLVATVRGPDYQPIEAAVVGRIDSIKGQIRASFEAVPDVPLSKVVIDMHGGKKGLLINSRDICARTYRVKLELESHSGAEHEAKPALRDAKCGKGRKAKPREHKSGGKRRSR
jgi:hypothetical protein